LIAWHDRQRTPINHVAETVTQLNLIRIVIVEYRVRQLNNQQTTGWDNRTLSNERMEATNCSIINPPAAEIDWQRAGVIEFYPFCTGRWIMHNLVDEDRWKLGIRWLPPTTD
jgi:hypothetical protein